MFSKLFQMVKHKSQRWVDKKSAACKEKVSHHCGTKTRGRYRFEICFCQPSLSRPKTSFALFSEVTLAQAAMTDTVKQPLKDGPINPRLALRFTEKKDRRRRSRQPSLLALLQTWRAPPRSVRNHRAADSLWTGTDSELRDLEALQ